MAAETRFASPVRLGPGLRRDDRGGSRQFGDRRPIPLTLEMLQRASDHSFPTVRNRADPGCSGFGWLACGAQPDREIISNVARMRPSASA